MKKINDFDKIQENSNGYKRLPDGGYIVGIKNVSDDSDKEFLRIELDVCKGEHKNYFQKQYDADTREEKWWPRDGVLIRSYKEKALPFFKGFITSITKSNKNFDWKWDEQSLKNKIFGVVFASEEYQKNNGKIGTRSYIASVHSVEAIEKGDFTVPELKKLTITATTGNSNGAVVNPFEDDKPTESPFNDNTSPFDTDDDNIWGD